MLSRSLLRSTRPSTLSSSLLARSYAAPPPSYTPRPTPPPPPPPPASSTFPTPEYTSPSSPTKQPPAWAAALARVSGIKLDDVKARAEALQSARNADGTIAKPTAAELREGMSNAKGSIAKNWMSSYQEEKARKSAKPKADGTWEELSFMEKLVPDKEGDLALRVKHEQKEFGEVLSPRGESKAPSFLAGEGEVGLGSSASSPFLPCFSLPSFVSCRLPLTSILTFAYACSSGF